MLKQNKGKILLSAAVILLPILVGLVLWNKLPERIVTHWGVGGEADGWSSRPMAVFFLPLFMLVAHLFCLLATARDPKNKNQNKKALGMVLWICPLASCLVGALIYATALGATLRVDALVGLFFGLMFVVLGNYLPKCRQNHTIGIRVSWTLQSEENWNKTHRMAGRVWVVGGLVLMAAVFLPKGAVLYVLFLALLVLAIVPVVYSYLYYRKQNK